MNNQEVLNNQNTETGTANPVLNTATATAKEPAQAGQEIKVGQIWADRDKRRPRTLVVEGLDGEKAICSTFSTKQKTKISRNRMSGTASRYSLLADLSQLPDSVVECLCQNQRRRKNLVPSMPNPKDNEIWANRAWVDGANVADEAKLDDLEEVYDLIAGYDSTGKFPDGGHDATTVEFLRKAWRRVQRVPLKNLRMYLFAQVTRSK